MTIFPLTSATINSIYDIISHATGESAWFRYHEGYKNQVQQWPLNPLDVAFKWLRAIVDSKTKNAIRGEIVDTATLENTNRLVAADFGCGEAELSIRMRDYNCDVHNFDLVAVNDSVTKVCIYIYIYN